MTAEDFAWIEEALSLRLPDAYRSRMCPFPILRLTGNANTQVWDDAAALISLNQRLRTELEDWPGWLFAIGQAAGDPCCYAVDTRDPECPVWWLDLMQPDFWSGPTEGSLAEWFLQWVAAAEPTGPSERLSLFIFAVWLGLALVGVMGVWAWVVRRIVRGH